MIQAGWRRPRHGLPWVAAWLCLTAVGGLPGTSALGAQVTGAAPALVDTAVPAAMQSKEMQSQAAEDRRILVMVRLPPAHFRADRSYAGDWNQASGKGVRQHTADELAASQHLHILEAWPMGDIGVECFVMEVPDAGPSPQQVVQSLSADPRVESAQTMHTFSTLAHNDPLYPTQPADLHWHLADLHAASTGQGVKVAVIDSGVDIHHPDLQGQVRESANVVDRMHPDTPESHGTAVAGIIAARADNGVGIAGVAPGAQLFAVRACWEVRADTGRAQCDSFTLAKAIQVALDFNVDVINMSLSGPDDRLLGRLIDVALKRGVAVVGASAPRGVAPEFPASHAGVLAACNDDEAQDGAIPAPGRDIPTTLPGGRWGLVSGTSFAAAHLSGLVALLRDLDHRHGVSDLSGQHYGASLRAAEPAGEPRLDACELVGQAAHRCVCNCEARATLTH